MRHCRKDDVARTVYSIPSTTRMASNSTALPNRPAVPPPVAPTRASDTAAPARASRARGVLNGLRTRTHRLPFRSHRRCLFWSHRSASVCAGRLPHEPQHSATQNAKAPQRLLDVSFTAFASCEESMTRTILLPRCRCSELLRHLREAPHILCASKTTQRTLKNAAVCVQSGAGGAGAPTDAIPGTGLMKTATVCALSFGLYTEKSTPNSRALGVN